MPHVEWNEKPRGTISDVSSSRSGFDRPGSQTPEDTLTLVHLNLIAIERWLSAPLQPLSSRCVVSRCNTVKLPYAVWLHSAIKHGACVHRHVWGRFTIASVGVTTGLRDEGTIRATRSCQIFRCAKMERDHGGPTDAWSSTRMINVRSVFFFFFYARRKYSSFLRVSKNRCVI